MDFSGGTSVCVPATAEAISVVIGLRQTNMVRSAVYDANTIGFLCQFEIPILWEKAGSSREGKGGGWVTAAGCGSHKKGRTRLDQAAKIYKICLQAPDPMNLMSIEDR